MSVCQTASRTEAPDRDAVLDHVGDDVDLRVAVDEALAVLLDGRVIERAEAAAERDQVVVGQPLAAEQQHLVIEPGAMDRGKRVGVDGAQVGSAAPRRLAPLRLAPSSSRSQGPPSTSAVAVPGSSTLRVGSMNSEPMTPTTSSPLDSRNGISPAGPVDGDAEHDGRMVPAMPNPVFMIPAAVPA